MLFFFSDAVANSQLVDVRWGVGYVVGTERHDDSSNVTQLHVKYVSYNEIQAAYKHRVSIHNTPQLSSTTITCNTVNLSFPPSLPPPALPVILPFAHNWVTQLWCHARRGATPNQMLGGIRRGSKSESRVKQVNGSLVITNATFADGEFQCFATNGAGMNFINITLLRTTECEALLLFFFFSSFSFLQAYSLIDSCLPFPFPQDNQSFLPSLIGPTFTSFPLAPLHKSALLTCEATGHPLPIIT